MTDAVMEGQEDDPRRDSETTPDPLEQGREPDGDQDHMSEYPGNVERERPMEGRQSER